MSFIFRARDDQCTEEELEYIRRRECPLCSKYPKCCYGEKSKFLITPMGECKFCGENGTFAQKYPKEKMRTIKHWNEATKQFEYNAVIESYETYYNIPQKK